MLKPVRWNTFIRDLAVMQTGLALFGLALALTIRANLGTETWAVLEVALAGIFGITIGMMTVAMGFIVLIVALVLRERVGWGTLANMLSIGPWLDLCLMLIPAETGNLAVQVGMLISGVLIEGLATALYVGVDAGAGPRDSLMLAVHRITGIRIGFARGAIEVGVVSAGWMLGGPAGIGTVVFAVLIGPTVQYAFNLFNVRSSSA